MISSKEKIKKRLYMGAPAAMILTAFVFLILGPYIEENFAPDNNETITGYTINPEKIEGFENMSQQELEEYIKEKSGQQEINI